MKKLTDRITLDSAVCKPRSIRMNYRFSGKPGIAMLYQHSDSTWHFDPETKQLGAAFCYCLLSRLYFRAAAKTENAMSFGSGVSEEQQSKPVRPYSQPIRVWLAGDIR